MSKWAHGERQGSGTVPRGTTMLGVCHYTFEKTHKV